MMKIYLKNKKHAIKRITRESEGILRAEDLIRASDKEKLISSLTEDLAMQDKIRIFPS